MTSPTTTADPGSLRTAVTLFAFAAFCTGVALRICDGLLPRLAGDFAITTGAAGQVVFTFTVAYGLAQLGYGPLGDRYGKARLVCIALFTSAAGALLCALAPGFDALVWVRIAWGLAAAGVVPLSMAWIGDAVPYEERQATLARFLTGTLSGMAVGQFAGGLFADSPLGWRGAFGALCLAYLVIAVLLFTRLPQLGAVSPPAGKRIDVLGQLGIVLGTPWARVVLPLAFAEGVFLLGPLAYLPAFLHQRFGLTLTVAAGAIALFAVGGLGYTLLARQIVRRLGERRMALAGGWGMGIGFLAWYLSPVAWLAAPIALLVGFGTYLYHNTLQANATQMAPAARGTGVSLFAGCLFAGQAAGVSWAGFVFDRFGYGPLLLIPAAGLFLAGWGFSRALRRRA